MDLTNRFKSTIHKLQALSSIQSGQYWNTGTQSPQVPGILTSVWRTLYVYECREINLEDIRISIESTFDLIDNLYFNADYDLAIQLQNELLSCRYGILNLKIIYHDCDYTKKQINNIVVCIKDKFTDLSEKHTGCPIVIYKSPIIHSDPVKILTPVDIDFNIL